MRYRLIAKTEGNVYLSEQTTAEREGVTFEFITDESGLLREVAVSTHVPTENIKNVTIQFGDRKPGEAPSSIVEGPDRSIHERLIHELQAIESAIAYSTKGCLKRIAWDNPKEEYVHESPDEISHIDISSFSVEYGKLPPVLIQPQTITAIVTSAPRYEELIIPKAFQREASNAYETQQYIQSFYNSFFIIEDFYARGKTREVNFIKQLARSKEFRDIAAETLTMFQTERPNDFERLKALFEEVDCEPTPEDLPRALFLQRGGLHHYYSRSPKHRGTPFNQREYQSLALFTMTLSYLAIAYRIVAINQSAPQP